MWGWGRLSGAASPGPAEEAHLPAREMASSWPGPRGLGWALGSNSATITLVTCVRMWPVQVGVHVEACPPRLLTRVSPGPPSGLGRGGAVVY